MHDLKIGKGRQVIKSVSTSSYRYALHCTAAYPGHEAKYPTLLLTGTMACGVCPLESSSLICVLFCPIITILLSLYTCTCYSYSKIIYGIQRHNLWAIVQVYVYIDLLRDVVNDLSNYSLML